MLDGVAYRHAEREEDDLRDGEEADAEEDVPDRPSVVERADDDDELRDDVAPDADDWPEEIDDPEGYGVGVAEPGDFVECGDGDEE